MSDYSVIDTVAVHSLEDGDVISFNNEVMTVDGTVDEYEFITVTLTDEMGDSEDYDLDAFLYVPLLAIIEEDVFI